MKKILLLGLMFLLTFCFSSCTDFDIPEGDIKDFVSQFDGEKAYNNVHYGKSYIVNTKYDGKMEVEIGKHTSSAYFDKRNNEFYHFIETTASGDYKSEEYFNFNSQKTVCFSKGDDASTVISKQLTDGELVELEYKYDEVINAVKNFFYTEVTAGFHSGGTYYGDYILKNITKYYDRFSLNEDKTQLTFDINISTPTEDGNEVVNCHKFIVDKYGMIISVETIAYYLVDGKVITTVVTEMTCDYVTEVEKIFDL